MNFFEHQEKARFKTHWLIALFSLCTLSMLILLNAMTYAVIRVATQHFSFAHYWTFFAAITGFTLVLILGGSLYKLRALADGGISVALSLGARSIDHETKDPLERTLVDVVEEMSIASGCPMPEIFVLDDEPSINAFAAGYQIQDAVIVVTKGTLQHLNRTELQGVIAHEFSHIFNGDMRLSMHLLGWINGLMILSILGRFLMRSNARRISWNSNSKDDASIEVIGLIFLIVGSVGAFFGRLIQAAVSREREVLADASAVQFTRNPEGIEGALKKIGGSTQLPNFVSSDAEDLRHFFFADAPTQNVVSNFMTSVFPDSWFATHPPIADRIRRIDPRFNGHYVPVKIEAPPVHLTAFDLKRQEREEFLQKVGGPQVNPETFIMSSIGLGLSLPSPLQKVALPAPELTEQARNPFLSQVLLLSLCLSPETAVCEKQQEVLRKFLSAKAFAKVLSNYQLLRSSEEAQRFSLLQLSIPSVKKFSNSQFKSFVDLIKRIIHSDSKVSLFEYAIYKMIKSSAEPLRAPQYYSLNPIAEDVSVLLSAFVYSAFGKSPESITAFQRGALSLGLAFQTPLPESDCSLQKLDQSLDRIASTVPLLKQKIIGSCVRLLTADQHSLNPQTLELLQITASVFHCPLSAITVSTTTNPIQSTKVQA